MAYLQINYFSEALKRITTFHAVLPNDVPEEMKCDNPHYKRDVKTLFLLHGFSGNALDWMLGSLAQELAVKYNMAIVTPNGENSFYLDGKGTGRAYGQYTGVELVDYMRKTFGLATKKEDTYIGGLSMGGFGAVHTGLLYPENFGGMFGLSSALIIHDIKNQEAGFSDLIADYEYYTSVFGDLSKVEQSCNNPEVLVRQRLEQGDNIQPVYMACGTEDFLIEQNRAFHSFLQKEGVRVTYKESPGMHDWSFWNQYLEPAIEYMLENNK